MFSSMSSDGSPGCHNRRHPSLRGKARDRNRARSRRAPSDAGAVESAAHPPRNLDNKAVTKCSLVQLARKNPIPAPLVVEERVSPNAVQKRTSGKSPRCRLLARHGSLYLKLAPMQKRFHTVTFRRSNLQIGFFQHSLTQLQILVTFWSYGKVMLEIKLRGLVFVTVTNVAKTYSFVVLDEP